MKQYIGLSLSLLLVLFLPAPGRSQNEKAGYTIGVELGNGMPGETVYLQKYVGRFLLKIDSFNVSADGKSAFFGKNALGSGMYALGFKQKLFCNFFISSPNSPNFSISLDLKNPAQTLAFTGPPENQDFVGYLRFLSEQQNKGEQAEMAIRQKGEELQQQFPGTMLALFIRSLSQPVIPEPAKPVANRQEYAYYYLANHFFDNIDFSDKRLLNTPILEQKLGTYFRQMVPPVADSAKVRASEVLAKARANDEVYNWAVNYLYQLYRESPIQDNSQVYNFIGEQYILNEPKLWKDDAFVEKVRGRVAKSRLNQVGFPATNLNLQTPEGKLTDLNSVVASKTILLFFNPGCEACHAVTEKLFAICQQYKAKGIRFFAVYTDRNKEEWQNYISAKKLNWINVFDPTGQEKIDQKYDIYAIPMIYVLDKDKKVIAKDVPVERLEKYLN